MLVKTQRPNHFKILDIATNLALKNGLDKTYVSMIAKEMGAHHSLIYTYYKSMESLRSKIIDKAIKDETMEIIIDAFFSKRITKSQLSDDVIKKIYAMFEK